MCPSAAACCPFAALHADQNISILLVLELHFAHICVHSMIVVYTEKWCMPRIVAVLLDAYSRVSSSRRLHLRESAADHGLLPDMAKDLELAAGVQSDPAAAF